MGQITELQDAFHATAKEHGFWEASTNIGEKIALIHSEASEALEEYRTGRDPRTTYYREDGKPEGFASEMADIIIRVFDLCGYLDIDLERMIIEKSEFNKTRPHMHGKII